MKPTTLLLLVIALVLPLISGKGGGGHSSSGGHSSGGHSSGGHPSEGEGHSSSGSGEHTSVGHGKEGYTSGHRGSYVDSEGHAISSSSPHTGYLIVIVTIHGTQHKIQEGCLVNQSATFIQQEIDEMETVVQNITWLLGNGTATNTSTADLMYNLQVLKNITDDINGMFTANSAISSRYTGAAANLALLMAAILFIL
jgi:hypothetical protein